MRLPITFRVIVRLSNPRYRDELERFLTYRGCRAWPTAEDELEVRVLRHPEALHFDSVDRAQVAGVLGLWQRRRPLAEVELVGNRRW